jgi:biopolymer transport protein ExbB
LVLSVIGLMVAIERGLVLRRARTQVMPFLKLLRVALIDQRSPARALAIARAHRGAVARVAEAALEVFGRTPAQIEAVIEREASVQGRYLTKRLAILSSVVNLAPLLGFLGTVTGMIAAFSALANFGTANPGAVASGISEALITTAAGLLVALPAQIFLSVYSQRIDEMLGEIERIGHFILEARERLAGAEPGL